MRALWLEDRVLSCRDDVPVPAVPQGEALVRVLCAGICNTDLELVKGYYPYAGIPGHEFVGRVESAAGAEQWVGRRVVGEISAVCGVCEACRQGRRSHCEQRTVMGIVQRNGVFAEHVVIPIAALHAVPDDVADDHAVFAEPLAAAFEVQEQVRIRSADRVVVIGDGKLGNLVAQTLATTGCDLLVIGRHDAKLDRLRARGIRTARAEAITDRRADVVVECTGNAEGFDLARRAVRPKGTIVLKSTYRGDITIPSAAIVVDELTLVGSRCGPFPRALEALQRKAVDVSGLVDARYPLADGVAAFERAAAPGVMKILLEC